jgi:hypothetical protein
MMPSSSEFQHDMVTSLPKSRLSGIEQAVFGPKVDIGASMLVSSSQLALLEVVKNPLPLLP